jgi:hypothetical protein
MGAPRPSEPKEAQTTMYPTELSNAFHPSEVEFIAEEQTITIVPTESCEGLNLISVRAGTASLTF